MKTTAILGATVALTEAASEVAVIEQLVDLGREMFSASFGASLLVDPEGQPSALAHSGMSTHEVAALPHLPRPIGLLGVVLGGETLRMTDLTTHPGAVGLPPGHVEMAALLAAPITAEGRVVGGVWFTRRRDEGVFDVKDEERLHSLTRLAGTAVVALQRRAAAQSFVGGLTDSGSETSQTDLIHRLLANTRDLLGTEVTFVARIRDGRQLFTDILQDSSGLNVPEGFEIDATDGCCAYMLQGDIPTVVSDIPSSQVLGSLPMLAEMGLGSYAGVPVHLPDGSFYGTLCGVSTRTGVSPTATQMAQLEILASMVGAAVSFRSLENERSAEAARAFSALFTTERHTVHLQPIVDLVTRCPVGYEALSRFADSYGAQRRPDQVFAQAAHLGLGIKLEQSAVRKALVDLPCLPDDTYLSVNLSPQALLAPSTFDLLTEAVAEADGRLVVEVTEHERVVDYPALLKVLKGLRERGLRLAVDDTGAGFSSLQHVTAMRPDIIKLDMVFVRDVHLDSGNRAVARALVMFAADIGATLIAEGIETQAELSELLSLGTPLGQGYLLGRPAPVEQMLEQAGTG